MENISAEREQPSLAAIPGDTTCIAHQGGVERRLPVCTASEAQVCQITHFLSMCNELLFDMCLQLREQPGGSLSLVSFEPTDICLMPSPDLNSFRAKTFLRWLLRSHLCITGLKLRDIWATRYGQFLFDELPYTSRLKKLILRFSFDLPVPTHITTLLPKLRSLEELSCSVSFQRTDALVDAVSALLRTTTCLSSLVFDASFHDNQREKTFLEALAANSTLKSLELRVCWTPDTARGPFGEYVRSNRLITNLTLLCDDVDREGLLLDETLVHNGTLSTLEIQKVCGGERTTRFLTRIIAECAALKKLTICEVRVQYAEISEATLKCFAEALAQNETLKELTLPYSLWHSENWITTFALLPRNRHLKKLAVSHQSTTDYVTLRLVLKALAQTNSSARISFEYYIHTPGVNLMHFKAFSGIYICGEESFKVDALQRLTALDHFTCLILDVGEADRRLFSSLAKYIQAATALRELSLRAPRPQCARSAATLSCWTLLFQSISANTSIADIEIISGNFPYMDLFGRTVGLSRNISRASLQLDINEPNATGFVVALSDVISDNYNLVEVSLYSLDVDAEATRCWFTIMDTTRRNSGLVNRAVVFKQSCPLDWYTATALEKVSRHPALLKVLAEKEGIAACDVARMVRSRLCSVDGLHDFMRLSGVVKERVTCVPPIGDSSKQLADLHIDCWRVLRRYLSLDDVKRFAV